MKNFTLGLALIFLVFNGCGGGSGGGSCPDVQTADEYGVIGPDYVFICEGCASGSEEFTCEDETLTITCLDGILTDDDGISGYASTDDCTEGSVACFNGAINTSCLDTESE